MGLAHFSFELSLIISLANAHDTSWMHSCGQRLSHTIRALYGVGVDVRRQVWRYTRVGTVRVFLTGLSAPYAEPLWSCDRLT